jgi:hypothetical protein
MKHSGTFVAHHDAPLIDERAATRGRIETEGAARARRFEERIIRPSTRGHGQYL